MGFLATPSPFGRPPSRRDWLRIGVPLGVLGSLTGAAPARGRGFGTAKTVIVVFASGGQSQLDTFDPKPDAPEEIRGAFRTIPTAVPGLRFGEHLPKLAKLADKYTVLKSLTHDDLDHGSACYWTLTGRPHARKSSNPDPKGTDEPTLGAVLRRVRPRDRLPHPAVHVNGPLIAPFTPAPGQFGGFLGRGYEPFEAGDVTVPRVLESPAALPPRRELLDRLDRSETRPGFADRGELNRQAFDFLLSAAAREAFDLEREPAKVRDAYGRHRSGQACLLARRLAEAGVPWVTVFFNHGIRGQDDHPDDTDQYGWDTHNDIFDALKTHLLPRFDHSFSTLLGDLADRGLLKTTLVVCVGEFGRAPRVAVEKNFKGSSPGRKHWAGCYSAILAGAGVGAGAVYGASDRIAAYPREKPASPSDLAATLFHALGIDPAAMYTDGTNRPHRIADGDAVTGLWG